MSDFDYDPASVGRVMNRVRSELRAHGTDPRDARPSAAEPRQDVRTLDEALDQGPMYHPPLAIDIQGQTLILGGGVTGGASGATQQPQQAVSPRGLTPRVNETFQQQETWAVPTGATSRSGVRPVSTDDPRDASGVAERRRELNHTYGQLLLDRLPPSPPVGTAAQRQEVILGFNALAAANPRPVRNDRAVDEPIDPAQYPDNLLSHNIIATRLQRDQLAPGDPRRAEHEQRLEQLEYEGDKRWGNADRCEDARPTLVPASQLPHVPYSPEQLLSCTGARGACASIDDVAAIEAKRQEVCAWTGVDPLRVEDMGHPVPVADIDHAGVAAQQRERWLQIIASQTENPLAAMAVIGSAAAGASVKDTANVVQLADGIGGLAASLAATGQGHPAQREPPPARGMRRPTPGPGLGPRVRAAPNDPLIRIVKRFEPERVGPPLASHPDAVRVIGDGEASYALDKRGAPLEARLEHVGRHPGRTKGYVPKPIDGLAPGDHRGHLGAENTVPDPRKANVQPNIISEAPKSNLGPKKRFDNRVGEVAEDIRSQNPLSKVETVSRTIWIPGVLRPVAVEHRIMVDGQEVWHDLIENK